MRFYRYLSCLILAAVTLPALAFDRTFPANVKSGKLRITDYPQIVVDGKAHTLSSGARIWSQDNLTLIPNALGSNTWLVVYTEDLEGAVDRVWLLTDQEAAALPAPKFRLNLFK